MPAESKKSDRHRLLGSRVYLGGAMDRVPDGGVGWRREITPLLDEMGIIVFDPSTKPLKKGIADETDHAQKEARRRWIVDGMFASVRKFMRRVRGYDLRMINVVDFVILRVDPEVHMCGSYEELAIANQEKKPVLVWVVGGKRLTPWWLFGMLPHEHFFDSMEDLMAYVHHVDSARKVKTFKRWFFFEHDRLYTPKILHRLLEQME